MVATKINQMEPTYGDEEIGAINRYLKSGGWITEFKETKELEQMIADYVGARFCAMIPNGTLTLWAALAVLDIGPGDEVIVPDYTMVATPNAVTLSGARPIFVDINREDLSLDFELTRRAITPRTRAIILVSIDGRCPRIKDFVALAEKHHLYLIEDAAQSLGSRVGGQHLGSFGVFGSFSFSMPKIITTGQGGALVTNDEKLYKKLLKFKDFGRSEGGSDRYEILGFNLKFSDLQAIFGIEQMKKIDWRAQRKKEIFDLYRKNLAGVSGVEFISTNLTDTTPWFIDILVPDPNALASHLKQQGIGTRRFYPTLHDLPFYNFTGDFPVASYMAAHGLWLPSACNLSDDDITRVTKEIKYFYYGR